jgi:hypothetical protein
MKLLNCILFASLALSATLVHADSSCVAGAGGKVGVDANKYRKVLEPQRNGSESATTSSNTSR